MPVNISKLIAAALLVSLSSHAVAAEPVSSPPALASTLSIPSWDRFLDQLRDLAPAMLARLPEPVRSDPQIQQEVVQQILASFAGRALRAISGDPDHPVFLPSANVTLDVRQPNADTNYRRARIAPGGVYRMRGYQGTLRQVKIGQYIRSTTDNDFSGDLAMVKVAAYNDLNELKTDAQGRYDVIYSTTRPAGYTGDWWRLDPETTMLSIRMVSADWQKERDPTLSIERLDVPVQRPRPSVANLQRRLEILANTTASGALLQVAAVEKIRQAGYINKLRIQDIAGAALSGQFYYEGSYDLKDDEALIVEAKVPSKCLYYSTLLANYISETIDWYNNQSSLNDAQSHVDTDGVLRIVVSAKDPGVPNWLDTAGHPIGFIQGRWTECNAQPIPTIRKVTIGDVRKAFPVDTPVVTPEQRQTIIREKRAAAQQRPLW